MHRLDRGDDRDVRPHQLDERRDLAGMVHADLEDAVARRRRHARQRQRHAPVVVERGRRIVDRALRRERARQHLLGAGLADAAGDGDDLAAVAPRARRSAEVAPAPSSRSSTTISDPLDPSERRPARSSATTAVAAPRPAPRRRNRGRRSCSPLIAKNASPGAIVRLSIEMPVIASGLAPSGRAFVAAAKAS